ncbi:MAG: phenylalanine--tRNA ligase subunit beta [Alphaproteobacteria bacterium]
MKFTLSWLKDHLETQAPLEDITETLTRIGLEIEDVDNAAERLAPFKVAEVVEAKKHPDADKLRVCRVRTAEGEVQVVCGAPNARTGMKAVFAPSGTYIPGTDLTLKPTKIRGVESNGMLVSEREMGLSDEHDGIIDLPESAEVGTPMAEAMGLNDPVIEIAITPNRPDCLGVRGVARDLAAAGLGTLKSDPLRSVEGRFPCPVPIALQFAPGTQDACPVFAGRVVRGVKNGPSPDWMQRRLTAIGLRPINALVDITNYISYDRGRPLHVYDSAKVTGTIHARLGAAGESLRALDGKDYTVDDTMCVIADDTGVLGLGGVMGGEASGSPEDTTEVLIESAYFDPTRTAETGRKTGILSDARYRFERGIDPAFVTDGLELATRMVIDLCGGEASDVIVVGEEPDPEVTISFEPGQVKRLTGLDLSADRIKEILERLGFLIDGDDVLSVTVPSWRPDVHGQADLVEEVMRIHGFEHVPATPLPRPHAVARPVLTPLQDRMRLAKRAIAARGLMEAVTWSFVDEAAAALFRGEGEAPITLANPIASDLDTMRPSVLPGLLHAVRRNTDRGFAAVNLFEAGPQFAGEGPEDQTLALTGVRRGGALRAWRDGGSDADCFTAKADALAALAAAGAPLDSLQVTDKAPRWYHPGRAGTIQLGPKAQLAHFGELHPRVLDAMDVKGPVVAFEVFPARLPAPKAKATKTRPRLDASNLLPVTRDFAFVVKAETAADALVRAAKGAEKKLITDVRVFDLYAGKGIEEGHKSLAIEVTLQPRDKTLTDEEIDAVSDKVVAQVAKATGGTLRG